ncbi:uncharacterized protein LOC131688322 [Topomyia yanbarensis]|uniref:uncharacterized protein LOC131688322 n=1 Tax=Topomyia yanbarensis TaxID=2498891 RepID=UPI00273AC619|nr:uncharacterized protein LOC131688322 [Topomyia yanbarensis]
MVTKAVHIELAVDLSTQAFINVLKRFVARRRVPTQIHSDNATNFIGANSALHELYVLFNQRDMKQALSDYCLPQEIKWHFIPARSPEFGGVWEAGIKSTKRHIKRVVGDGRFTYDEWNTLVAQIEAILNSRPLVPQSADPNDLKAITPGHKYTVQISNHSEEAKRILEEVVTRLSSGATTQTEAQSQIHRSKNRRSRRFEGGEYATPTMAFRQGG